MWVKHIVVIQEVIAREVIFHKPLIPHIERAWVSLLHNLASLFAIYTFHVIIIAKPAIESC